jgi:lactoylglutathione lyase
MNMRQVTHLLLLAVLMASTGCAATSAPSIATTTQVTQSVRSPSMDLGNFSISLAVKDIAASRAFYERLGFKQIAGEQTHNWLIMQNGSTNIGLFQGMFEKNTLTFNPGWDAQGNNLASFTDIRELQKQFKAKGITLQMEADESTTGPASIFIMDPDGNPILIDQHR